MRRILALLLSALIILSFAACSSGASPAATTPATTTAATAKATITATTMTTSTSSSSSTTEKAEASTTVSSTTVTSTSAASSSTTASTSTTGKPPVSSTASTIADISDGASLEEILKVIESEEITLKETVEEQYAAIKENITDFDSYIEKYNLISDWYSLIDSESAKLYERINAYCDDYYRKAFEMFAKDDKSLDRAIDDIYDAVYSGFLDDIYDDIYDGVLDDVYDDFYDGLLDDAYEHTEYKEWYNATNSFYTDWYEELSTFYKRWYSETSRFYTIWYVMVGGLYSGNRDFDALMAEANAKLAEKAAEAEKQESPETTTTATQALPEENKGTTGAPNDTDTVFEPQDVSDATIESIRTYDDYLTMYQMIVDDYMANYERVVKGSVLYSEASFQQMKDGMDKAFEEQENAYGALGNAPLVGKDSLVEFLKNYRDSLKAMIDTYEKTLKALS